MGWIAEYWNWSLIGNIAQWVTGSSLAPESEKEAWVIPVPSTGSAVIFQKSYLLSCRISLYQMKERDKSGSYGGRDKSGSYGGRDKSGPYWANLKRIKPTWMISPNLAARASRAGWLFTYVPFVLPASCTYHKPLRNQSLVCSGCGQNEWDVCE